MSKLLLDSFEAVGDPCKGANLVKDDRHLVHEQAFAMVEERCESCGKVVLPVVVGVPDGVGPSGVVQNLGKLSQVSASNKRHVRNKCQSTKISQVRPSSAARANRISRVVTQKQHLLASGARLPCWRAHKSSTTTGPM